MSYYSRVNEVILAEDAHSTGASPFLTAPQIIERQNRVLAGVFVTLRKEKEVAL
jgi:orotate phosphoribosyltransferase